MNDSKVTTRGFEDQGFEKVYIGKNNDGEIKRFEVEFAKNIEGEDKILRVRVSRNLMTNKVTAHFWKDNHVSGNQEEYAFVYVVPDSPRIKADMGID